MNGMMSVLDRPKISTSTDERRTDNEGILRGLTCELHALLAYRSRLSDYLYSISEKHAARTHVCHGSCITLVSPRQTAIYVMCPSDHDL